MASAINQDCYHLHHHTTIIITHNHLILVATQHKIPLNSWCLEHNHQKDIPRAL